VGPNSYKSGGTRHVPPVILGLFFGKNMAIIEKINMYHFNFENCAKKCQKEKFKNLRREKVNKNVKDGA